MYWLYCTHRITLNILNFCSGTWSMWILSVLNPVFFDHGSSVMRGNNTDIYTTEVRNNMNKIIKLKIMA